MSKIWWTRRCLLSVIPESSPFLFVFPTREQRNLQINVEYRVLSHLFHFSASDISVKSKETYGVSTCPIEFFGKVIQILDHTFVPCYVDVNALGLWDWWLSRAHLSSEMLPVLICSLHYMYIIILMCICLNIRSLFRVIGHFLCNGQFSFTIRTS